MMKTIQTGLKPLLLLLGLVLTLGSCSSSDIKSLSELKSEQSSAINRLISERGIKVVALEDNQLPSVIDPSVYYLMPNGLYIQVIDPGTTGQIIKKEQTRAYVTFKGFQFSLSAFPGSSFDSYASAQVAPVEFIYRDDYVGGPVHFALVPEGITRGNYEAIMCEGLAYPLSIVDPSVSTAEAERLALLKSHTARLGNGARLSLIIPFEVGPSSTYSQGISVFMETVEYTIK